MHLPPIGAPRKHPKPLKRLTIPVALLNLFRPTSSTKYIVVNELIPARIQQDSLLTIASLSEQGPKVGDLPMLTTSWKNMPSPVSNFLTGM